jgi:acyl carrier protein
MTGEEILTRLRQLLRAQLGYEGPVEPESELAADLGLDSVKLLTLVVELENAFRVALEPEEGETLANVGQVVALIERCLAQREAAA